MSVWLKTSLCALELKYITRRQSLGIRGTNSFLALLGKGGGSRLRPLKRHDCLEAGTGAWVEGVGYREIWDLAGFDKNCVRAANLVCLVFRAVPGS